MQSNKVKALLLSVTITSMFSIQGFAITTATGTAQVTLTTEKISKIRGKIVNDQSSQALSVTSVETAPITKPLAGVAAATVETDLGALKSNVQKVLKTSSYKDLGTKYHTPTTKEWIIKFSNSNGKDTSKIDLSNVKVIDKYGNTQKVEVSWHQEVGKNYATDKRSDVPLNTKDLVIKAPQGGYKEGQVYAIVIGKGSNAFKDNTVMSFVVNKSTTYAGIRTRYGTHTYGCKTQAEYDKVMAKLEAEVAKLDNMQLDEFTIRYLNGERDTDYQVGSEEYKELNYRHRIIGYALTKCSQADILKIMKGGVITSRLNIGVTDPGDGTPNSAYDVLFRDRTDCDASSQVTIAILDILGYNTVIVKAGTHAYPIAEIGGKWWSVETEVLSPASINSSKLVGPTFE